MMLLKLCCLALSLQAVSALAANAARPDFSGFWQLSRDPVLPDPQLVRAVPVGTVELKDTGALEFGAMDFGGLKLTVEALAAAREWKPEHEMTLERVCRIPSIAYALQGPFPIEIHQATELLVMRMEYYDMTRVIFTDGRGAAGADMPHTKTGYSVGQWEGDTLVVKTSHLKEATLTNNGLEHSDQLLITERFRLSADGKQLQVSQEYDDPKALQNRGVRYIAWRKVEGDHVRAYDCDPSFVENYRD